MTEQNNLVDEFLQLYAEYNPIQASELGIKGYDHLLPVMTLEAFNGYQKQFESLLHKVQSSESNLENNLLEQKLKVLIMDFSSGKHHQINPAQINALASNAFFTLMMDQSLPDNDKAFALSKRLEALPHMLETSFDMLTKPVRLWNQIACEEIPGTASYLNSTILPFLKAQKVNQADALVEKAHHSLFDLQHKLEKIESFKKDFAIGQDQFEWLVSEWHGLPYKAHELKEMGFAQIDELNSELNKQALKLDDTLSWEDLINKLKNNHPTEENLLNAYKTKLQEIKTFLLNKNLVSLPKEESLRIMETPEFLQDSIPFAAYSMPSMFGKNSEGLFFVSPPKGNADLLKEHCFAAFPLTVLHEGYPGHHLQFAFQRELKSRMSKIHNVSSNYEGWTLYCEEMMSREGYYDDAMRLYQLKDRLWRACRIVVDVSMHCYGMTDVEATGFLVDQAKLSKQGARVDVNWYTQYPTIPMSYLVGTLELEKIREAFMKKRKSLKEFHDAFLQCGAIPLRFVRDRLLSES